MKISIRYKLFLSHFLAILLVSGSIGSFFYAAAINNLKESLQSRLKYSAAILSNSFAAEDLDSIRTKPEASHSLTDGYLAKLRAFVDSNPDIAFIYVMSLSNNQVRFVLDSDTEEPAELGELYEEFIPELIRGFKVLSVDKHITSDKWGSFMSGYAPIKNGDIDYLVGIDMHAEEVNDKLSDLKRQGLVSLILSVLFAYACASFLSRSMLQRIAQIHQRCLEHSPLKEKVIRHPGDELDGLNHAFTYMLESVEATHEHLERQVKSRTRELEETNSQLSNEVDVRRRMEKVLKENSNTDYLTRLPNRLAMINLLIETNELGNTYSLIVLDLDNYKRVNAKLGQKNSDDVLRKFARSLLHLTSEDAVIARWSGEEFMIFLPCASLAQASQQAERIRDALVEDNYCEFGDTLKLSACFGIVEHKTSNTWEVTVELAESALQSAKAKGYDSLVTGE